MLIVNIVGITLLMIFLIILLNKEWIFIDYLLLVIIILFIFYLGANIYASYSIDLVGYLLLLSSASLLFFPFIIYALLVLDRDHHFKKSWMWFGIFDALFLIFLYTDIFTFDRLETYSIQELLVSPPISYLVFYKAHGVYKISVLIWLLSKTRSFSNQLDSYYSNKEHVSIQWLRNFIWIYLGENVVSTIVFIPFNLGYIEYIETPYLISNLVLVFSWFYLIYFGVRQFDLANFKGAKKDSIHYEKKYLSSSLSEDTVNELYSMVQKLFEEEKIFHNPELRVQDLANRLGVTNHNVSQVLNQKAGKTFYEFVNSYRVNFFKELLKDPEKKRFTILALGMESGFNSKASLNRVFKQQIGKTPREYLQQISA